MTRTIVLYHSPCWDGLVAAWSLGLDRKATTYIEYDHSKSEMALNTFNTITAMRHRHRIIAVDCFPEWIRGAADEVIVIDHHESAKERLEDRTGLTEVVFDMTHSAAVLARNWALPNAYMPRLNRYVEDRDLWKWELPDSHAVNAYIGSHPLTFDEIHGLDIFIEAFLHERVIPVGKGILDFQAQHIAAAVKRATFHPYDDIGAATVNCTANISEVGHELLQRTDVFIAFMYRIDGDTLNVSVRTHPNSPLKANEIAARYGGGGHPQAAGFHMPVSFPLPFVGVVA